MSRKATRILLGLYAAWILSLLLVRHQTQLDLPYWQHTATHISLIPLQTIRYFLYLWSLPGRTELHRIAAKNLLGNIILFIPLGWLLPIAFPRFNRLYKVLLVTAACIAAAELTQMLLLVGTCDIDDLILNTLGTAIGYLLYKLFRR